MNVLLLGSGGREHALAWKLAQSPQIGAFFALPGNPGIAQFATCFANVPLEDHDAIVTLCLAEKIDLVVVGPEAPLVDGIADRLVAEGIPVFGPRRVAAQLEGSKLFTKELCKAHNIPTAAFGRFIDAEPAKDFVQRHGAPIVLKADGLMAGKGVIVAMTLEEALAGVDEVFAMGGAGTEILIEEYLAGEEVSFFCLVDGETVLPFGSAQDHKRAFDGDEGPNTGGMGAYSPAPVFTAEMERRTLHEIVKPTARALADAASPYRGVLFAGLMITAHGPKLIEYNVRFGDPECQVLLMRMEGDLLPLLAAVATGRLEDQPVALKPDAAICVVMATKGYPGAYPKGSRIGGLEAAETVPGVKVFHAGTRQDSDDILANGGRVLNVTAVGANVAEARERAYDAVARIDWPEGFCRHDIAWRALDD
ncbi:phosphoribosylamine--glycine ligase [Ancylobacter dichloromethanicus]|uniref:Phosphoribosylamine--glycine ligase n=1 Tax=Ancylobacter dichloromethanicus TaxID=518825 RepID=A0A9W6MZD0_9HYPH|nr:phosphoribosylamine--glycine ligase [Ancylobacter dichloromethanicus]MBS7552530.1 phosphoribosylamine--glycine ligase [Ancylobacter dichloromethanicus]GLK71890.1 phosphoribosylamine--glycine ligase [Ancylobacter dichloromethanicus]